MTQKKDQHTPGANLGITTAANGGTSLALGTQFKSAEIKIDDMVAEINRRTRSTGVPGGQVDTISQQDRLPSNDNSPIERGVGGDMPTESTTAGTTAYSSQPPSLEGGLPGLGRESTASRVASASTRNKGAEERQMDGVAKISAHFERMFAIDRAIKILNQNHAFVLVGGRDAILRETRSPTGEITIDFLTITAFKQRYANIRFPVEMGSKVRVRSIADVWMEHPDRRTFEGVCFAPAGAPPGHYNLWRGFSVKRQPGDCSLFLAHMRDNICSGDQRLFDWVIAWFAQLLQEPDKKPGTAIVLRGKQGTGKSIVGQTIGRLIQTHYKSVSSERFVTGQFNGHLKDCLLLQLEEAFFAGDHAAAGVMKDLITGKTLLIEWKGREPVQVDNHVRLIITSNCVWVVPAAPDDRRFAIFEVSDAHRADHAYFKAMQDQLDSGGYEALLDHLLSFDCSNIDLRRPPHTSGLIQQKLQTLDPVAQWWAEVLENARLTGLDNLSIRHEPWDDTVLAQRVVDSYEAHARRTGVTRRANEMGVARKLFEFVPGLAKARTALGLKGFGKSIYYRFPSLEQCRRGFLEYLGLSPTEIDNYPWPTEID